MCDIDIDFCSSLCMFLSKYSSARSAQVNTRGYKWRVQHELDRRSRQTRATAKMGDVSTVMEMANQIEKLCRNDQTREKEKEKSKESKEEEEEDEYWSTERPFYSSKAKKDMNTKDQNEEKEKKKEKSKESKEEEEEDEPFPEAPTSDDDATVTTTMVERNTEGSASNTQRKLQRRLKRKKSEQRSKFNLTTLPQRSRFQ